MSFLSLLAIALLWLACARTALAAAAAGPDASSSPPPRIWSGLVLATNDSHPSAPPGRLGKFAEKLKKIFGYNHFELVSEYSEKIDGPAERWLIPSKDFYLSVKSHNGPGERYPLKVTLFQTRHRLAEFETHLSPDSPLFIRGPQYAKGQLVIVLHVADPSEAPVRPPDLARPPVVLINPTPLTAVPSLKDKDHPNAAPFATIPRERLTPPPPDHFGPAFPDNRFGPGPNDRFGPFPGGRGGDMDSKLGKP